MMPSSHSFVFSSPQFNRIAVTITWNDAFVGGKPMRPFHLGSVKSQIESGNSSLLMLSVL